MNAEPAPPEGWPTRSPARVPSDSCCGELFSSLCMHGACEFKKWLSDRGCRRVGLREVAELIF